MNGSDAGGSGGAGAPSPQFTFTKFAEHHLKLLRTWLNKDHIKPHWQEPEDDEQLKKKFITDLSNRSVHSFIFEQNNEAIGYIQYYEACRVGGGWWPAEKPGTFGIDIMIGNPNRLGQGLSTPVISEFMELIKNRERVEHFIIDPDVSNFRAIRAFEKAGFSRENELITPNGRALLMRRPVSK